MADVEIYFALGMPPILIGAGSHDELRDLATEAQEINAKGSTDPTAVMGEGTKYVLMGLGYLAGVSEVTAEVLELYDEQVRRGRSAFVTRLKE